MSKSFILLLLCSCCFSLTFSQTIPLDPANAWIVPGQTYIRIVTEEEGIYRVTANDLQPAGFNAAAVNPDLLHLLYRGVELPIHVTKSANQLVAFEFYSPIHDSGDETFLYRDIDGAVDTDVHPNPRMSQISKESAFFLTWDAQAGQRYTTYSNFNYSGLTSEPCFRTKAVQNYTDTLVQTIPGYMAIQFSENPLYVSGEGYAGPYFESSSPVNFSLATPHGCPNPDTSILTIRAFGNTQNPSHVDFSINGNVLINSQQSSVYTEEWVAGFYGILSPQTAIVANETSTGRNFVSYVEVAYDRTLSLDGDAMQNMQVKPSGTITYYHWENALAVDSCWVFDITNGMRISGTANPGTSGSDLDAILPANASARELYLVTDQGFQTPTKIEAARLEDYTHHGGVEFIIITDRSLQTSADQYATYRSTSPINAMTTAVFYTDALYDEFGYGSSTPLAIKRFLMTAMQNWTNAPKYVLLWGKAQNDSRNATGNLVPTWGYPAFDIEYGCNFDVSPVDYHPKLSIGRIPAMNDAQGQAYLSKAQLYESYSFEPWMLNAAFFSYDPAQNGTIHYSQISSDSALYINSLTSGTAHLYHTDTTGLHSTSALTAHQAVNQGVAWIDFKDFGADNGVDYNCNLEDPSQFQNQGKFPFVTGIGSMPGRCLDDSLLLPERWVLEPSKGAIGFLGAANVYFSGPWFAFMNNFLSRAYGNNAGIPIGEILDSAFISSINQIPGRTPTAVDFVLYGDPSIVIVNPFTTNIAEPDEDDLHWAVYPNPFSESVQFDFALARQETVELVVHDLSGKQVASISKGILPPGQHQFVWNAGINLANGMYVAKLNVGNSTLIRKLVRMD